MHLSPHFSLSEFVNSPTANRLHINNTPNAQVISNLRLLCENILEPLRAHINESCSTSGSLPTGEGGGRGRSLIINSGYRCEALNRAVGGAWNSNHLYGYAADIRINNNAEGKRWFDWIKNTCNFDELIWETADGANFWIHVAYRHGKNRRKVISYLRKMKCDNVTLKNTPPLPS